MVGAYFIYYLFFRYFNGLMLFYPSVEFLENMKF